MPEDPLLFAPVSARSFGDRVAQALNITLAPLEERDFDDGEHKSRPLVSVRGRDVYVIESLCGDATRSVDEKLVRMLFLLGTMKDGGAARVSAVLPYLCYARKDRQTKPRDPVNSRYLAVLFEAVGVDRVLAVDVHNLAAYQNAFRIPTEHLEARSLLVPRAQQCGTSLAVVSPDVGGVKRAHAFRQTLESRTGRSVTTAFMEKHRSGGRVTGDTLVGAVEGRTVVLVDDLIASGTTMIRAARACRTAGAAGVVAMATHGAFSADAGALLADPVIDQLVVTNSVVQPRPGLEAVAGKLKVVDISGLVAECIRRMNDGGSLVALGDWAP